MSATADNKKRPNLRLRAAVTAAIMSMSGTPQTVAEIKGPIEIDLASQPLAAALEIVSATYELPIISTGQVLDGKNAPNLVGRFTTDEAVARLLQGSGLTARRSSSGALLVSVASQPDTSQRSSPSRRDEDESLEELVVVAPRYRREDVTRTLSRTDIDLKELASSVTVITSESIEDRNAFTTAEVVGNVAGVTFDRANGRFSNFENVTVRGVPASGISAGIRDDGFAGGLNYPADVYTFDRVEVIKGPASISGGIIVPGGFINRITKSAEPGDFSTVSAQATDHGQYRVRGDVNRTFGDDDQYSARVVAAGLFGDEFYDNVEDDYLQLVPSFKATLSDRTEVTVLLNIFYQDYEPFEGIPINFIGDPQVDDPAFNLRYDGAEGTTEHYGVQAEVVHRFLDDLKLTTRLAGNETNGDRRSVYGYTYDFTTGLRPDGEIYVYAGNLIEDTDRLTADVYLTKDFQVNDNPSSVVVGLEYLDIEKFSLLQFEFLGFDNFFNLQENWTVPDPFTAKPFVNSTTNAETLGFYSQFVVRPIEGLTLSGGLRFDNYDLDTRSVRLSGFDSSKDGSETTFRFGASYEIDAINTNVYASYSTGFSPLPFQLTRNGGLLEPETSKQVELGFKSAFADGRALLTVAAYRLIRDGTPVSDPVDSFFAVSGGETTIDGVEVELAGEILPGWDIALGLAFMDPEITEADVAAGQVDGEQPAFTTDFNGGLVTSYSFSQGALRGLRLGGSLRHVGERVPGDLVRVGGFSQSFTTTGIFGEYAVGDTQIGLFVNNVFDEVFIETARYPNYSFLGFGRNFTLRVTHEF